MIKRFERTGPLMELSSYPQWAQDMVGESQQAKQDVLDHELWDLMRSAALDTTSTRHFMVSIWPFIERFPGYMAHSLLKTQYGRSLGDDVARRWLVRNIRVEQNHAEYWLNWAEGAGVPRKEVLQGVAPHGTSVLADWCEDIASRGTLAAGMAATNYAIEGVTGEWAQMVYDDPRYVASFPLKSRTRSLRWLQLHAAYDDTHPWEALEIICTIMGTAPTAVEVAHLGECVRRSYVCMRLVGDRCMQAPRVVQSRDEVAA